MVVGGQNLADDEKEATTTLGPHRDGVSGHEGAKFQMEMGAGTNGGAPGRLL
jgi:hypothetical protein